MDEADKPEHLRLFIAIQMPEHIKVELAAVQAELRRLLPGRGVTWTKSEQFHLTLKFLGQVEGQRVAALSQQLRITCQEFSPLHLRAEGVGAFPDLRFPRVIWVGLNDNAGSLAQLQAAIEVVSRDFVSVPGGERFSGHATLGRAKRLHRLETQVLSDWLARQAERSFGKWTAAAVELMRSELSSAGAQHRCLERFHLSGLTPNGPHE